MDQEGILLSVVSQTEKDKYGIISFACEAQKRKKKKKTHIRKQRQSHTHREQTDDCQRGGGLR